MRFQISFLSFSLDRNLSFHLLNTLFPLKTSNPHDFRPNLVSNHLVWSLYPSFFMHFKHLDLGFGFLWNFWGFWKLMNILWNFWVRCYVFEAKCSCIASHLHFHNVSYIYMCDYMLKNCVLLGLDWVEPMMHLILHVTCSCTFHAFIPFLFYLFVLYVMVLFCFFLSLSRG